ncbi:MAG: AI-2E family transporter [Candidatus Berkiella sp.]
MTITQQAVTSFVTLLCIVLIGWLTYLLSPVLTPFLVATFLAYLTDPLVEKLAKGKKFKIPRTVTVIGVFLLMFLVVLIVLFCLVPVLQRQLVGLATNIPLVIDWLQQKAVPQLAIIGVSPQDISLDTLKETVTNHAAQATAMAKWLWQTISHSGMALLGGLTNVLVALVALFYLLRDWPSILESCKAMLPKNIAPTVQRLAKQCDIVLATFVRGQLTVMTCLGTLYGVGLALIGVNFSLLLGVLAGVLSIVPYLGSIVGLGAALIVTWLQFQAWLPIVGVLVVFGFGQALEGMVLTPILIGDKLGLHPVVVIFAVLAGGHLLGFVGVLLALPITAMLVVLVRELASGSTLYG